jgi:hypothetical protein
LCLCNVPALELLAPTWHPPVLWRPEGLEAQGSSSTKQALGRRCSKTKLEIEAPGRCLCLAGHHGRANAFPGSASALTRCPVRGKSSRTAQHHSARVSAKTASCLLRLPCAPQPVNVRPPSTAPPTGCIQCYRTRGSVGRSEQTCLRIDQMALIMTATPRQRLRSPRRSRRSRRCRARWLAAGASLTS